MTVDVVRAVIFAVLGVGSSSLFAAVTVNFYEQGGGVVAEASGSLNVGGLTPTQSAQAAFIGTDSLTYFGYVFGTITATQAQYDVPFTIEQPFGPLSEPPSSSSGDTVGIVGNLAGGQIPNDDAFYVPGAYVSGAPLDGSSTWAGATLASLNLLPGTYTFTYATDSFIFNVLTSPPAGTPVPLMPLWLLFLLATAVASIGAIQARAKGRN